MRTAVDGPVARLAIHNPSQANALTPAMFDMLGEQVEQASANADIRLVVLRGTGGTFSSGYALTSFPEPDDLQEEDELVAAGRALARCPKATLAVLEGSAIGAALDLALAADFRIATQTLRSGITPARFGIIYPWQGIDRLVDRVGPATARRLLLTAEILDADAALAAGLVDEVADESGIDELESRWVGRLTGVAPLAVAGMKSVLDALAGRGKGDPRTDDAERQRILELRRAALASVDAKEAAAAFREKRNPVFVGR